MGKITFEFDDTIEEEAIKLHLNAYKWKSVVYDLYYELNKTTEENLSIFRGKEYASDDEIDAAQAYKDVITNLMKEQKLNIEEELNLTKEE
jgi:hypothetical protein